MRRVLSITVFILLASLTGCSGDTPAEEPHGETSPSVIDEGDPPVQTPAPCAEECSNQEVADSGCDAGVESNAAKPIQIGPAQLEGIAGVLELRMADPAVCESLFWARFRPYAETSQPWKVTIMVTDRPREEEVSVKDDPVIVGYTEGVHAAPGADIAYCVGQNPGENQVCATEHINEGGG